MTWLYLDDGFPEHPKVLSAGGDAAWLFVCGLAYAKRNNSKTGFIPAGVVARLSDRRNPRKLAQKLVEVLLWEERAGGFQIHDFDEWNRQSLERSEAARRAAKARWGHASASEPHMPEQSESSADAMPEQCLPQSPIPIPHPLESSSVLHTAPPAESEDDELWNLYADRRLAAAMRAGPVGNAAAWRATTIANGRSDLSGRLAHLRERYDLTLAQLADVLASPTIPVWVKNCERRVNGDHPETEISDPLVGIRQAQAAARPRTSPAGL